MMSKIFILLIIASQFIYQAHSKIIKRDSAFFVKTGDQENPIFKFNTLIKNSEAKDITIFNEGNIHLVSVSLSGEKKLFSVDQKGFLYDIKPFSNYTVREILPDGRFIFLQLPGKVFRVDQKGLFVSN